MRVARLMAVWVVGLVLVIACAARAAEGVRIVELRGDGAQIGAEHGKVLGEQIKALQEQYLKRFLRDDRVYRQALMASMAFRSRLEREHLEEIGAIAEAAKIDPGQMLLANCFLDLVPSMGCSTMALAADASSDGVARFGRNLDFPSYGIADKNSVLLIVKPKGRHGFAAVSWPGLVGVLSGMNEHGLCVANMEVGRPMRVPEAMPYTLLYRVVLERCRTVGEAVELLKKTPRQSANNLMMMDAAGDRAVAEITPEGVVVRRGQEKKALLSTNHHRGEDQDTAGKCWRYDRMKTAAEKEYGRIGVLEIEKMLDGVAQKDQTMQSMVFEPAKRVLYLAAGENATKRAYERIELGRYFGEAGE